jgi:hypothetical protein
MADEICYVTRGTVQFIIEGSRETEGSREAEGSKGRVLITPIADYATKHKETSYVIFLPESPGPSPMGFRVGNTRFTFLPELREVLIQAAFKRTSLEITIDEAARGTETPQIKKVTIPATP